MHHLSFEHPLAALQAQAALATGWPTLIALRADEAGAEGLRAPLEAVLGALPQLDVIEPFEAEHPWEVRVDLPDLDAATWERVQAAVPDAALVPGLREGARAAWDQGHLEAELLGGPDLYAATTIGVDGGVVGLDLQHGTPDDEVRHLEHDLALAVQAAGVRLPFASDRGTDTITPVVHRATGRFGVQIAFAPEHLDPLDGEALDALRVAAVQGVAQVVHARTDHPVLRLAPDLCWDARWGFVITAWIVAPAAPALPGDQAVPRGLSPMLGQVERRLVALGNLAETLEVHVVPERPEAHFELVDRVVELAREGDWPLLGGLPRWVRFEHAWHFVPTWRLVPAIWTTGRLQDLLLALVELEQVEAVRLVPGEPEGLGEAWQQTDPGWHLGPERWMLRLRDGLTDRDRQPATTDRPETDRDREVRAAFSRLLRGFDVPMTAIQDSTERQGLAVPLGRSGALEGNLRPLLEALASIHHPDLASLGHWSYRDGLGTAHLWYQR